MARYIATDLDETLLSPIDVTNLVPEINREVLKKFDGTILVSGRNCAFIQGVCKEIGIEENFVAYNGAMVYKDGKEIYKVTLDKDTVNKIIDYVKEKFTTYTIFLFSDDNKIYTINDDNKKREKIEKEEVKKLPRHRYTTIKDEKEINELLESNNRLMKMNIVLSKEDKAELYKQLSGANFPITFTRCRVAIEIISGDANKGKSLELLTKKMDIDKNDVFVVGDDNNDLYMFDYFPNSFLIKSDEIEYDKGNYNHVIKSFASLNNINVFHMHPSNFTFYHLVKYYIELTEALEYTLITYKYQQDELHDRFKFLKDEYKKGFFNKIIKGLFKYPSEMCDEIRLFIKNYNAKKVASMVNDSNLHSRIIYNRDLYLAVSNSLEIINLCLDNERIRENLEDSLIELIETTTKHFDLFYLFNTLNLYVASKVAILQGAIIYDLEEEDKTLILTLLSSLEESKIDKKLLKDSIKLIKGTKKFDEEDAYEVLNQVSIACIKEEKNLYTYFESFTSKLEKEIEKLNK